MALDFAQLSRIFYHFPCHDGSASAAVIAMRMKYEELRKIDHLADEKEAEKANEILHTVQFIRLAPGVRMVSADITDSTDKVVLILDITPHAEDLRQLVGTAKSVHIIDHHESELPTLAKQSHIRLTYSNMHSACILAWNMAFGSIMYPPRMKHANTYARALCENAVPLLRLIDAHDRGIFTPDSELLFKTLAEHEPTGIQPLQLVRIFEQGRLPPLTPAKVAGAGVDATWPAALLLLQTTNSASIIALHGDAECKHCSDGELHNREWKVVYAPCANYAHLVPAHAHMQKEFPTVDIFAFYRYDTTKGQTIFSLRRGDKGTLNLGVFAKHLGGGGHAEAAGVARDGDVKLIQ